MPELETDQPGAAVPRAPLDVMDPGARILGELRPAMDWAMAGFAALASAIYSWSVDGPPADVLFVTAATFTIGALIAFFSQRVLFAAILVTAILILLRIIAVVKQQETDVVLHSYDLVSFLNSRSAVAGLWHERPRYAVGLLVALLTIVALGWIAYRVDGTRVRRARAAAAAALFVCLAWIGANAKDAKPDMAFYYEKRQLSFFLSSWSETTEALWRGHLIDAAGHAPGPTLNLPSSCDLASKPPNIILIHQESVVPPSYFPTLSYERSLDSFFHSYDGKLHKLRVETYGGASWLTEFSVLTGLSTFSLGRLRQFAQTIMAGKMRETLPQALARCGYRNITFHPMLRSYLSIETFLTSVGMHRLFDAVDQRATADIERDRVYYANALAEMERHFKTSGRPLFTFVETMATHGSYDYTYMPDVNVPGGGAGTHPEMHEYLRRLSMASMDYTFLRSELFRRFPGEQFLIINYGDHHPLPTLPLLGFRTDASIDDVLQSGNEAAFITYYSVDAVRYLPPPLPNVETLDIPYLATVILGAAGLPLSDTYQERKRLMMLCHGRYHRCAERNEILRFHRRLIDSGILDAL